MRLLSCFFAFLLLIVPAPVSLPISSHAAESSVSDWHHGYSLIVMSHADLVSARKARDYVTGQGGRIALIASPHVMTGWLPSELSAQLIGQHGIERIAESPVDPESIPYANQDTRAAILFFNEVTSTGAKSKSTLAPESPGEPLIGDAFERPAIDYGAYLKNLESAGAVPSPGNSDSMTGTVAVSIFFIESDGSEDRDTYTWTETDQQDTITRTLSGLSWWSSEASKNGVALTFTPFYYLSSSPVSRQGYEPILHTIAEDHLWIDRIMENVGFLSGNTFDRVVAFNTWRRQSSLTDWAFSVFIAYNPAPAPSKFANGSYFSYSFYGGPYVQTLFNPDGWGQANFDRVLAHETGHIFWACDEYYQAGYGGCTTCGPCTAGPRPQANNGNCEYCNPNAVSCMMRDCSLTLCQYTRQQVGWPTGVRLSLTPAEGMKSLGPKGGPFSAQSKRYTIRNEGDSAIEWTAANGQVWTRLSTTGGTLSPGSATEVTVSLGDEAQALAPGSYTDTVVFTNATNGEGTATRVVNLTVTEGSGTAASSGSGGGGGGGGCFIASAAFGGANTEEVCVLRHFRDEFLTRNAIGRLIVRSYYRYSPALATRINKSPMLKALTRAALEPLVVLVKWTQKILGKHARQVYINGCERRGTIQRGTGMAAVPVHKPYHP